MHFIIKCIYKCVFCKTHESVSVRVRLEKLTFAVREIGVSYHCGVRLGPPLTPRYHSVVVMVREKGVSYHFGTQLGPPLTPRYHSVVVMVREISGRPPFGSPSCRETAVSREAIRQFGVVFLVLTHFCPPLRFRNICCPRD